MHTALTIARGWYESLEQIYNYNTQEAKLLYLFLLGEVDMSCFSAQMPNYSNHAPTAITRKSS